MRGRSERRGRHRARGASLVELIVAIVVVGVLSSAALGILGRHAIGSTDALMTQQAMVIARGLLEEIQAQGTDATDPDGGADGFGPESGEQRGSASAPFDHVNDYDGYTMSSGIVAADGTPVPGLENWTASVSVTARAIADLPASHGFWISVTVTGPGGASVVLEGFRARLGS